MMRKRLIPVLLLDRDRRLVKTVGFGARTYIGDPFNVIRLFNEKEVDEICILDIDAGRDGRAPDVGFLSELASECFMPLSFGGGLRDAKACAPLARAGVEKLVLGAGALDRQLVGDLVATYGSSSVVACIDYRIGAQAGVYADGGTRRVADDPIAHAATLAQLGVGEVIVQSIERDGGRDGMDLATIGKIAAALPVPLVALGGAGTTTHLYEAIAAGASAGASGSAFSFIGPLRAVLITYPEQP